MPFQELADRSSGQLLGASYLNALSENVEWLWGAAQSVNMPFQGYRADIDDITDVEVSWYIRHRYRYLHYIVNVDDPLDHIRLKASSGGGAITLFSNESPGSTQSFASYADTNGLLTAGTWYKLWWEIAFDSGVNSIAVEMMAECDATSFGTETNVGYLPPPTWERGDTVSHTNMNLYKTGLDACRSQLGDEQWAVPVRVNNTQDRGYFLFHRYRWLFYVGDGEIVDPSGAGDTIDLPGNGANVQMYDLLNVDWLAEGRLYEVKDVTFCCEDYEP